MKKITLILSILLSFSSFAQKEVNVIINKIEVKYIIYNEEREYKIDMVIKNNSENNVYLPELISDDLNFFSLGNKLFLYYGLSFSLLGEQNPASTSKLIELKGKENYYRQIIVSKTSTATVDTFCIGFEYLPYLNKKNKKKLELNYTDYSKGMNNFYSEYTIRW